MSFKTRISSVLVTALLAVAAAPSGEAIYMYTPLGLSGPGHADVGDEVSFDLGPNREDEVANWSGKPVRAFYTFDLDEGVDRSQGGTAAPTRSATGLIGAFVLDEDARGAFVWVVPSDVRDRNVIIHVEDENGELVATHDIGVGDAPPMFRALESSTGGPVDPSTDEGSGSPPVKQTPRKLDERTVPAFGILTVAVGTVAVAGLLRR